MVLREVLIVKEVLKEGSGLRVVKVVDWGGGEFSISLLLLILLLFPALLLLSLLFPPVNLISGVI